MGDMGLKAKLLELRELVAAGLLTEDVYAATAAQLAGGSVRRTLQDMHCPAASSLFLLFFML